MRAIHAALPALLLAGCGLLYAEIEIPKVEVTLPQESFPAADASGDLTTDFTYDLGSDLSVITENDVTVVLRLLSMQLVTDTAGTDLSTIETFSIVVVPPAGSGLPEVPVLDYTRPATTAHPLHLIELASSSQADLGPYLTAGSITLRASATGSLPPSDWTGAVTAAFYLKVRYPYGKQIKL